MKIEIVPIERVKPYRGNPRINQANVEKVSESLKEFGWRQPIVVDRDFVVIAGHTRLKAAEALGWLEVPVHVAENLSPAQAKAYRLADNRLAENSLWDNAKLCVELADLQALDMVGMTGFTEADLARLFGEPEQEREWEGMPEFRNENKQAFRSIIIHFADQESVEKFAKLLKQEVTPKTRFLWFPKLVIERFADKRYAAQS